MAGSTATDLAVLQLIFNATAWANFADNTATSPLTSLDVALMTADPGKGGTMSTSEIAYTGYARASVARTTGGWTVSNVSSNGSVSPVSTIGFPIGTGGAGTASFFAVGKSGGGAVAIIASGTVTPNIVTGNAITPQLSTASAITLN